MKYLLVLKAYFSVAYVVFWIGRRSGNKMIHELKHSLELPTISTKKAKRMRAYAEQCLMSASWFCVLRNDRINRKELRRCHYLGAFASVIDDINDNLQLTFSEILIIIRKDEIKQDDFKIAKYLFNKLTQSHNEHFIEILMSALKAQDDSIKLLSETKLENCEIEEISRNKGGLSMLLYRVVLDDMPKPGEAEAIKTLGYVLQLADDMFDIYEDHKSNQQTLFTNSINFNESYTTYTEELNRFLNQTISLPYKKRNITNFLLMTSTILGRAHVCANQLRLLQKNSGNSFDLNNYDRKQLICDMEKPRNILASISYSIKFYEEISSLTKEPRFQQQR